VKVATPAGGVSVAFDGPENARLLIFLAHGAGGDMNSGFMTTIAGLLADHGLRVCRFNFPYMEQGRRSPDRQGVLEEAYRAVVTKVQENSPEAPVVVGGKSLGGRIASHVVADGMEADGLVFLGYPLHPPGRPDRLLSAHLEKIKVPMLFVEGTRDPFCPLDTLADMTRGLDADTEVAVVDDGDHSLKVRKSSGRSTEEAWAEAADLVAGWLTRIG
jgi:predicted alpha/beta-hydrolase family hydrolase